MNEVLDVSQEELTEYLNDLFRKIISEIFKQRAEAVWAAISPSFEECKQEIKRVFDEEITAETLHGLSCLEVRQKVQSILRPIEDKYEKQRQEIEANIYAEYKVKLDNKIAETNAELSVLFRSYFVLKERQKFATLTPSQYRCF